MRLRRHSGLRLKLLVAQMIQRSIHKLPKSHHRQHVLKPIHMYRESEVVTNPEAIVNFVAKVRVISRIREDWTIKHICQVVVDNEGIRTMK